MNTLTRTRARRAFFSVSILAAQSALAGNVWDGGGGNNNWTTGANWNFDNQPPANNGSITVVMGGTTRLTPNVNDPYDIFGLLFNIDATSGFTLDGDDLTIRAGGIGQFSVVPQTVNNHIIALQSQTWDVISGVLNIGPGGVHLQVSGVLLSAGGARDVHISGPVTGNGQVIKHGAGRLQYLGATTNTYAGTTTVNAGTLMLSRTSVDGSIRGNLVIGDGTGVDAVGIFADEQILGGGHTLTINSSGILQLNGHQETIQNLVMNGGSITTGTLILVGGGVTTNASSTSARITSWAQINTATVADGAAADDLIFDKLGGSITKNGPGQMVAHGSGLSLGATGVNATVNAGTMVVDTTDQRWQSVAVGDDIGGAGADVFRCASAGLFHFNGSAPVGVINLRTSGHFDLNGFSQTVDQVAMTGGQITLGAAGILDTTELRTMPSGSTATISDGTLQLTASAGSLAPVIVPNGPADIDLHITSSVNAFDYSGGGKTILSGATANTATGSIVVQAGTLVLSKSIADGAITNGVEVRAGATLSLAANEQIAPTMGTIVYLNGGTLALGGFSETIDLISLNTGGNINFGGGMLTTRLLTTIAPTLNTGSGTLAVTASLSAPLGAPMVTISGNLSAGGGTCSLLANDGTASTDMEIVAAMHNGSFIKGGLGQVEFTGSATNTYTGVTIVSSGTLLLARTASANASIAGNLTVGDTGTVRDVARTASNEQIANTSIVTVNRSGWFDIIGSSETIGGLSMSGGSITTGLGTLTVNGDIAHTGNFTSTIAGNLDLGGATRTLTVGTGTASVGLDIPATVRNGGMIVQGGGRVRLGGSNTFTGGLVVNAGTLLIGHDSAAGSSTLTISNAAIRADGTPRSLANAIRFTGPATIDGSIDLTLTGPIHNDAGNSVFKRGLGRLTIAGAQNFPFASTLDVIDGTVTMLTDSGAPGPGGAQLTLRNIGAAARIDLASTQHILNLVANAGTTSIVTGGGGARNLVVNGLFVDTTDAFIDVWEHAIVVDHTGPSQYSAITSLIASARNNGLWNGTGGITSSLAATHPTHSTTIGAIEALQFNSVYGSAALFQGEDIDDSAVLVKYTWYGDTDLNGVINFDDYGRTDNGFNTGGNNWFRGDFDFNNFVNFDDYALIDLAFNTQSGTLRRAMSFLEGSDRSDAGMDTPALRIVQAHFVRFGESYANSFLLAVPEPSCLVALAAIAGAVSVRRFHPHPDKARRR